MASLKEIKARINSVSSTLKITQAMKMVSSAKLRRVQRLYASLEAYRAALGEIASAAGVCVSGAAGGGGDSGSAAGGYGAAVSASVAGGVAGAVSPASGRSGSEGAAGFGSAASVAVAGAGDSSAAGGKVAVVVFSSDTSLCGSYNANIFRALQGRLEQIAATGASAEIIPVGEKVAKMAAKVYGNLRTDFVSAADAQSYDGIAPLLEFLLEGYRSGRYSRVELLYMHFYSVSRQRIECRTYLGGAGGNCAADGSAPCDAARCSQGSSAAVSDGTAREAAISGTAVPSAAVPGAAVPGAGVPGTGVPGAAFPGATAASAADEMLVILEPSAAEIAAGISDLYLRADLYATLLSAKLSEHACRMVAMQTASDNAEDLLGELRLTFNKQRQSDITEELSDISNSKIA